MDVMNWRILQGAILAEAAICKGAGSSSQNGSSNEDSSPRRCQVIDADALHAGNEVGLIPETGSKVTTLRKCDVGRNRFAGRKVDDPLASSRCGGRIPRKVCAKSKLCPYCSIRISTA
jgi:hypothetical protein